MADVRPAGMRVNQPLHFWQVFADNGIAQFKMQGLANDIQIAVLAENGRDEQPVIGGAHAAVAAVVTVERSTGKAAHVRRGPLAVAGPVYKRRGGMRHVIGGHQTAFGNESLHRADQHSVHDHLFAGLHFLFEKLVLGVDIVCQHMLIPQIMDGFARVQILQGHDDIIRWMDFQDALFHL